MNRIKTWKSIGTGLTIVLALSSMHLARAQGGELTSAALANAEYPIADVPGGKAQLKDGTFDDPAQRVNVTLVAPEAFGDANRDGQRDAAVHLAVNTGGSGVFSYLAVVLNEDGVAKPVDSVFLGDRIKVRNIVFGRNFEIQVGLLERRFDQAMVEAPTIPILRRYRLNADNKLVAVGTLSNADINYAAYPLDGTREGRVFFTAGRYEDEQAQISAQIVRLPRATGDIDGDGSPDTAVVMVTNTGGGGVISNACAVLNKGYLAQPAKCEALGDRVRVTRLSIGDGQVTATYLDRGDDQPMSARPTVRKSTSFSVTVSAASPTATVPTTPTAPTAPTAPTTPITPTTPAGNRYDYTCANGAPLSVTYSEGQAVATFGADIVATLRQLPSASGTRYGNDAYELLSKGQEASVLDAKTDNVILADCKTTQPIVPPAAILTDTTPITPTTAVTVTEVRPTPAVTDTALVTATTETTATTATTDTVTMTETTPALSGVITGTVTYLQRIALDPGAVIEVSLNDVSRADAPATLITSQIIQTLGKQVPIPFELKYDPAVIDPRMTYAIGVRITVEGQLRWINTTRVSVLTRGAPVTDIEVVVDPVR